MQPAVPKPSWFIENTETHSLLDELKAQLPHAKCFDVLTGYFRLTCWSALAHATAHCHKVRILVGLSADHGTHLAHWLAHNTAPDTLEPTLETYFGEDDVRKAYQAAALHEVNHTPDSPTTEASIRTLIHALQTPCADPDADHAAGGNGMQAELRIYRHRGLHAKVYILRNPPTAQNLGMVYTGSSNVSLNGLRHNLEFNVRLRQDEDVQYATHRFEELWRDAVPLENVLQEVVEQSWLREDITPYELYFKMLYCYFEEQINTDIERTQSRHLPDGYLDLTYQWHAALECRAKLKRYRGVFLADVVGLGKTIMGCLLMQLLQDEKPRLLVVAPPVLVEGWQADIHKFRIPGVDVISQGKLEDGFKHEFDYILVDEAHRFRNDGTQRYEALHKLAAKAKGVILVGATPLNNRLDDIAKQLYLFQPQHNSTLPGLPNIKKYFDGFRSDLKSAEEGVAQVRELRRIGQEVPAAVADAAATTLRTVQNQISQDVRDRVLRHVMVRRTRRDIERFYSQDLQKQQMRFPALRPPQRIVYELKGAAEAAFNLTLQLFDSQQFTLARYAPKKYLLVPPAITVQTRQDNIRRFMRILLVKRLESSFVAFKHTIARFIRSNERFLAMLQSGTVWIGQDQKLLDAVEQNNLELLEQWEAEDRAERFDAADFHPSFAETLEHDLHILRQIDRAWQDVHDDPKLLKLESLLRTTFVNKQLIIFTESSETAEYIYQSLLKLKPDHVMCFHGQQCWVGNRTLKRSEASGVLQQSFHPSHCPPEDSPDIQWLVTTDVLAEGVNLHRAQHLLNYDLPWNPTRVLQRVGRINRVGSPHTELFVHHVFPTTHGDAQLGQETNILKKLQLFHTMLGEDARYLHEEEELSAESFFEKLMDPEALAGEDSDNEDSDLAYLAELRQVRDTQPDLFERIRFLPAKVRVAYVPPSANVAGRGLLTFFRQGQLRRFYFASTPHEIGAEWPFVQAARAMRVEPTHASAPLPTEHFYRLLEKNKEALHINSTHEQVPSAHQPPIRGASAELAKKLIALQNRFRQQLTDADATFWQHSLAVVRMGSITPSNIRDVNRWIEKNGGTANLSTVLDYLKQQLGSYIIALPTFIPVNRLGEHTEAPSVILSCCWV